MQVSRRSFLQGGLAASAATFFPGCCSLCGSAKVGRPAVQLYSIREYIGGKKDGSVKARGLAASLQDLAKIGYKAVEFAGYYDGANDPKILKKYLDDAGLVACGTHVSRSVFEPDVIKKTIEFNLAYGNNHLICPGGGNTPPGKKWGDASGNNDDWWKFLTEFYSKAADTARAYGCTLGIHNHCWEFDTKTRGTTMWEYFFANTPDNVCMEQDVGWTVAAGYDPCAMFAKFPRRSPTLHAKENASYMDGATRKTAPIFEGILGQPGKFADGKTVKGVDWKELAKAADADGVKWWVVECERNAANLKAVADSFTFLKSIGKA